MTRRSALVLALPPVLAVACVLLAGLCPLDTMWGHGLQAALLTAPPWCMAAWLPAAVAVGLRSGQWRIPVLCALAGLACTGLPWVGSPPPPPDGGLRLVSANVNSYPEHDDQEALVQALVDLDADVLVVIERRAEQLPGYVRVADNFDAPMDRISHASAAFCRDGLACTAVVTPEFGSETSTMPLVRLRVQPPGGGAICVFGVHGPPPLPKNPTGLMPYFRQVATMVDGGRATDEAAPCVPGDPVVAVGDFNAVPRSPAWRLLVERGLDDAQGLRGLWAPTWPAGGGWPDLPLLRLDHVLTGGVPVVHVAPHRVPGSDHKALAAVLGPAPAAAP